MPSRLVEYAIPPGFVDGTKREVKGRYVQGNLIRFRNGRIRPIGGWQPLPLSSTSATLDSAVRGSHSWRNNIGVGNLAYGTKGVSPAYGKLYVAEIATTPTDLTDATAAFTVSTKTFLTTNPTYYEVGDVVVSASNIASNTIITAVGTTANGSGQYTITMSENALQTASSQTVTITPRFARQRFYDITPTGYQAAGESEFRPGYGYFSYGGPDYDYSTVFVGSGTVSFSKTAHWTLDSFGEWLVGCHSGDRGVFVWQNNPAVLAKEITTANGFTESAPTALAVVVSQERHLVCLGADNDTRLVKWSSQETIDVWNPLTTNTAGDFPLQTNGNLVCGRRVQGGILLFTDQDTHLMQYVQPPLVYAFQKQAESSGVASPYAVHSSSEITAWLNKSGFWSYDGYVRVLECPIADRVLRTVDWTQEGLITSGSNSQFNEIWWWCPSVNGEAGKCQYYIVYNYRDNIWYDSTSTSGISRNSWVDKDVTNAPLAVDPTDNTIYQHESTAPDQTEVGFAETGAIDIMRGERYSRISRIYSDTEQALFGDVSFQFFTADSAESPETVSAVFPVEDDGVINTRLQGRQVRFKISGKLLNDFTVGATRLEIFQGGNR
jgi:hypothetical protein